MGATKSKFKSSKNGSKDGHFQVSRSDEAKYTPHSYERRFSGDSQAKIKQGNEEHNKDAFIPKAHKHLIVDDAKHNRTILSKYLERFGISTEEAENGKAALKYLPIINEFDIVWMDIRMPILNGFDCTLKIREEGYENVIIGVTGDVSRENVAKCYDVGMNHVILKPVIYSKLINLTYIKKYLEDTH